MKDITSNCCGAEIYDDTDICEDCKEHCGAIDENEQEYEFIVNSWKLCQKEHPKTE